MKTKIKVAGLLFAGMALWSCGSEIEDGTTDIDSWTLPRVENINYVTEFRHPGIFHTQDDIERLRGIVESAAGVAYENYLKFAQDVHSSSEYNLQGPFAVLTSDVQTRFGDDFSAAYQNAVMYAVTGKTEHADKAMEILAAYASEVTSIPHDNAGITTGATPLFSSNVGLKLMYAAELMRYLYPQGMTDSRWNNVREMFRNVFVPVYDAFYAAPAYTNGNWGASVTKGYIACAILLDDSEMYRKAVDFYLYGADNGNIRYYIDGETGQCQESGRDQQHVQLGLEGLAGTCEIAYKQGTDLYSVMENRLLTGYEYTARYNLGYDVSFKTWEDMTVDKKYSNWTTISSDRRGEFRPIYEEVYNHYVNRMGLSMPYTEQIIERMRTEGGEEYHFDHMGFGTFLFNEALQ